MKKKISVVTICYNAITGIEATILSVINQTYKELEYIIIDGASTDGSIEIINKYNQHITFWISEKDNGIYDAMNKGIQRATGNWIIFMNAGDRFVNESILDMIFNKNNHDLSDILYGDCIYRYSWGIRNVPAFPLETINNVLPFSHQSVFIKTELMKKNPFNLQYRYASDYNTIYNLYLSGNIFEYIPIAISNIEMDAGATYNNFNKSIKETLKIHLQAKMSPIHAYYKYYKLYTKFYIRELLEKILPPFIFRKIIIIKNRKSNYIITENIQIK